MFSHQQISRWLSFSLDPITLEDWLANREIFGPNLSTTPENEQLESAYQIETIRAAKSLGERRDFPLDVIINGLELSGFQAEKDFVLIAPTSHKSDYEVIVTIADLKPRRLKVSPMDFLVIPLEKNQPLKIKAKNLKDFSVSSGKTKIIIDTRGRPINFLDGRKQQDLISKMRQQLT